MLEEKPIISTVLSLIMPFHYLLLAAVSSVQLFVMFYFVLLAELRQASGEVDFDEAHEFRADKPEECLFILGRAFLNYGQLIRLKSFTGLRDWYFNLQRPEIVRAYEFYKQELQLIGNKSGYQIIFHCIILDP